MLRFVTTPVLIGWHLCLVKYFWYHPDFLWAMPDFPSGPWAYFSDRIKENVTTWNGWLSIIWSWIAVSVLVIKSRACWPLPCLQHPHQSAFSGLCLPTAHCLVCNLEKHRLAPEFISSTQSCCYVSSFSPPLSPSLPPFLSRIFFFFCQDTWQKFRQWGELFDFSQGVCVFGVQLLFPSSLWDLQRQPVHLPQRLLH